MTRSRAQHVPMPETVSACTRYTRVYGVRMATTERQHDLACMPSLSYHSCVAGQNKTELLISIIQFTFGEATILKHSFHIWNKLPWKSGAHDHSINQSFCELLPCNAKELLSYHYHWLLSLFAIFLFTHDLHFFWQLLGTVDCVVTVQSWVTVEIYLFWKI